MNFQNIRNNLNYIAFVYSIDINKNLSSPGKLTGRTVIFNYRHRLHLSYTKKLEPPISHEINGSLAPFGASALLYFISFSCLHFLHQPYIVAVLSADTFTISLPQSGHRISFLFTAPPILKLSLYYKLYNDSIKKSILFL